MRDNYVIKHHFTHKLLRYILEKHNDIIIIQLMINYLQLLKMARNAIYSHKR